MSLSISSPSNDILDNAVSNSKLLSICSLTSFQPTYLTLVPPLVTMLAMSPQVSPAQLAGTRVISSGGSPISASVLDKLREKTRPDCDIKVRH